ncbi:MAG: rod shape-determining protein MreC [Elusimicrobia bacterium]|nr:rod shape-determining protein MreC [Candidatus Liberimonas magnetica]
MTTRLNDYVIGFKNFLFYLISPTPIASSKVINSSQRFSKNIKELVKAHQENINLKKKLEKYARLENEYVHFKEENTRLRNIFEFLPILSKKAVVATVVSREPNSWFQWVIIGKGKNDGLVIDAPVLAWEKNNSYVLGRVGEVFKNYSKVILVTNAFSALPAMTGISGHEGLIEGQNNSLVKLNYLMKENDIKVGDKVVTSPLSSVFPPNILIGRMAEIAPSDDERFKSVFVEPGADINNLKEVIVLIPE